MRIVEVSDLVTQSLSVPFQCLRIHLIRVSQSGAKRGSDRQKPASVKPKPGIIEEPKKGRHVRLAREFMQQWEVIVQGKQRRCGLFLAI